MLTHELLVVDPPNGLMRIYPGRLKIKQSLMSEYLQYYKGKMYNKDMKKL
jgi:hypothetical protein